MARTWTLSFFLIESSIKSFVNALDDANALIRHNVKSTFSFEGALFTKTGDSHPPAWSDLVDSHLTKKVNFPDNENMAAVLFVQTKKAIYAYTFGIGGRNLLDPDAIVPDFGKKTVLSIVDPKELHSVDLRAVRDQPMLSRQQATRATSLRSFGIDTLQDHLRGVTGTPNTANGALAKRVTGSDALQYVAKIDFADLGARSDGFLAAYRSNAYQMVPDFKWVDQVRLVRKNDEIDKLNKDLIAAVKKQSFEMAPPDVLDSSRGPMFALNHDAAPDDRSPALTSKMLVDAIGAANLPSITVDGLKDDHRVYCFYNNEPDPEVHWRAYDCIEFDLKKTTSKAKVKVTHHFSFAAGRWSEVDADFTKTVGDYVTELRTSVPLLPAASSTTDITAKGHLDEGGYLSRITSKKKKYVKVHLNGDKVFGPDGNEVEFCDVYAQTKDFMHFKIWRGSQGFSALAMQAANAAELLVGSAKFANDCSKVIGKIDGTYKTAIPARFDPRQYRILICLIRAETGDIPFFSQLTLMRAAERIRGRALRAGYTVVSVN